MRPRPQPLALAVTRPPRVTLRRWFLALWLACAAAVTAPSQAAVPKEYQVKAAFLYNFTKFVEWPAASFPSPADPIVIAVVGDNPFGDELEKVVRDRRVNGRSIVVLVAASAADARQAHVVFTGRGQEAFLAQLRAEPALPALTVGESEDFSATGGMVQFTNTGDKVRFEINVGAAERVGLKISAQLQKLATAVHRKS